MNFKLDKDFVLLLVGRVSQAFLALLAIRILTTFLDKENVGMTYLVTSITTYFSLIFINPVGMYLNRKLHEWFLEHKLFSAFRVLNVYFFGVSVLSVPIVLFSYFFLNVGNNFLAWQILVLVFFNIYIGTWFHALCSCLNMLEKRNAFVRINLLAQLIGLSFSVLGIFFIQKSAFIWLIGLLLGQSVGAIFSYFEFQKLKKGENFKSQLSFSLFFNHEAMQFGLPIAAATALMWLHTQSYRIIVEVQMGAQSLAILGVGLSITASIAALVESLVNQYFYPKYYAAVSTGSETKRSKAWNELFVKSIAIYLPTALYMACCGQFILRVLVNQQFEESIQIVYWGAFIELARMLTNIVYIISQSEMKTRLTVIPYFIGAVIVVAGVSAILFSNLENKILLIPPVITASGFFILVVMSFLMRKLLPVHFSFKFAGVTIFYCLPFIAALFIPRSMDGLFFSLIVCGFFGTYLLFIFSKLLKKIPTF